MLGDSLPDYELFIYSLQNRYPIIETTTLVVVRQASDVATIEGDLASGKGSHPLPDANLKKGLQSDGGKG
jgi:hypothetical protein